MKTRQLIAPLAVIALATSSASAVTVLFSEDFQSPTNANNFANPPFAGWTYTNSGSVKSRIAGPTGDLTGTTGVNQGLQFEWTNTAAHYDTTHDWDSANLYGVTLNATPQSWNGTQQRFVEVSLTEGTGGPLLWSSNAELSLYEAGFAAGNAWDPTKQEFSWQIDADAFAGTEGSDLTLNVFSSGFRGLYIDNVSLSVLPEPSSSALMGIGGLALLLRRRR